MKDKDLPLDNIPQSLEELTEQANRILESLEKEKDKQGDEHSKDEDIGTIDYNRKEGYEDRTECVEDKMENFFETYPDHATALDHQMDGMDIKSIADIIGRSAIATKELLSQARKKIAPSIEECLQIGVK